ncbi:hypothetical protein KP509_10G048300 [Ceratopteris richardii]|uniref:AAA+ ATPase domain-containing protein n=1 Tax=Ceratopteris richardii TaxID=49495 RepID=A0A8T2TZ28_CERRI|nr:hypothetical protein KP509_10G048300 [Ceratopteris richardii]
MEGKEMLLPAIALGLGLGIGVATSQTCAFQNLTTGADSCPSVQLLELELRSQVVDGKESAITFEKFPYYISDETRRQLTNAAFLHLKRMQFSKLSRNLSPASRTVLLSGPTGTETYHQMLAKALSHFFGAKLLIFDVTDFSLKIQNKCGGLKKTNNSLLSSITSGNGVVQRFLGFLGSDTMLSKSSCDGSKSASSVLSRSDSGSDLSLKGSPDAKGSGGRRNISWAFEDKMLVVALYRVLMKLSELSPIVLYLRDVENLIFSGPKTFYHFQRMVNKLSGSVFIMGSRTLDGLEKEQVAPTCEKLTALFPYKIDIKPPEDNAKLVSWKSQLEEDMKAIQAQDNRNRISEILAANDIECDDLNSIIVTDKLLPGDLLEEIVFSAISHHLMNTECPQNQNGRLIISSTSLAHGLSLFQAGQLDSKDAKLQCDSSPEILTESPETSSVQKESKTDVVSETRVSSEVAEGAKSDAGKTTDSEAPKKVDVVVPPPTPPKEIPADNEFEKRIRPEIIPAGEIGVSFQDIGALENVKESLEELVMLPLQRPDLFSKGGLIKPCKGILLFGPPGTGKTMLAKAVATEANASFINVSMSTITSKWFGEDEKNVRALFTLAAKVAPTVIFIDEVDSMLGQRSRNGEHEAMRKIKNEFMAHWDGLLSKTNERVLVLAATNRPFDLDDAIIRRFERRIMVGLPDRENREKILRIILEKETIADDVDFGELAGMTEGFSGSDLKNLCRVAAYRPIRELIKLEKQKTERKKKASEGEEASGTTTEVDSKDDASSQGNPSELSKKDTTLGGDETPSSTVSQEDGKNTSEGESEETIEIPLRPLSMEDLKEAKKQISSSFAAEGAGMAELKQWNELYGEGGNRKKQQLTYFM